MPIAKTDIEDILVSDAKRNLVPKLKRITPVHRGDLINSIDAVRIGRYKRSIGTDKRRLYLVNLITVRLNNFTVAAEIAVGAVNPPPPRKNALQADQYGNVLYTNDRSFAQRWDKAMNEYSRNVKSRIELALIDRLGLN